MLSAQIAQVLFDIQDGSINGCLAQAQVARLRCIAAHVPVQRAAVFMAVPDHTRILAPGEMIVKSWRFGDPYHYHHNHPYHYHQ